MRCAGVVLAHSVVQEGMSVLCDCKTHAVGRVQCVGVNRLMTSEGPAAGGFAILTPLPVAMWGTRAAFKLSLRKLSIPSEAELEAAVGKEESKLPAKLSMVTKGMDRKVIDIDAGRRLAECTLEVWIIGVLPTHVVHAKEAGL